MRKISFESSIRDPFDGDGLITGWEVLAWYPIALVAIILWIVERIWLALKGFLQKIKRRWGRHANKKRTTDKK